MKQFVTNQSIIARANSLMLIFPSPSQSKAANNVSTFFSLNFPGFSSTTFIQHSLENMNDHIWYRKIIFSLQLCLCEEAVSIFVHFFEKKEYAINFFLSQFQTHLRKISL